MKKHDDPQIQINDKSDDHEGVDSLIDEYKTKYVRALADYQNLEKRKIQEVSHMRQYAAERLLIQLLPIVDTFEKAQEHIKDEGLGLAINQLRGFLKDNGVRRLEVIGKEFDPYEMECIEVVDGQDNKVIDEILPGYMLYDKIIRPAKVKVGKQTDKEKK